MFSLFYHIVMETLFSKRIWAKHFYKSQFRRFRDENVVYLELKSVLNKKQSGW